MPNLNDMLYLLPHLVVLDPFVQYLWQTIEFDAYYCIDNLHCLFIITSLTF